MIALGGAALAATLLLAPAASGAPPANDSLALAEVLAAPTDVAAGDTQEATREALEPDHAGAGGEASLWYRFTAPFEGVAQIAACDGDFSPVLAVYEDSAGYPLQEVQSDSCQLEVPIALGQTYLLAVDGSDGERGAFVLRLDAFQKPANDDFANAKPLSGAAVNVGGDNRGASRESTEPDHFPGKDASVWYEWVAPDSGAVRIEVCDQGEGLVIALYSGTGIGALTNLKTRTCEVTLEVVGGATYRIAVDGDRRVFNLHLEAFQRPPNDDFANPTALTGPSDEEAGDNRGATRQVGEPSHGISGGTASVWYSWTAPATGGVEIDTCSEDFPTDAALYTGSALNALTVVARPPGCRLRAPVTAGVVYRLAVQTRGANPNDPRGTFDVRLRTFPKPANDDFAAPDPIAGSDAVITGDVRGASREAGEPVHNAVFSGIGSGWYAWEAPLTGRAFMETCNADELGQQGFRVAAYTGDTLATLEQKASGFCWTSFRVTQGTTYRLVVEGRVEDPGSFALRLRAGPTPDNDDFLGARPLSGTTATTSGSNLTATHEAKEPSGQRLDGASVWFAWTAPQNGTLTASTCGSGFDTTLTAYTGSSLDAITAVGFNDDGTGTCAPGSRLAIPVTAGTQYFIALDGERGNYTLALSFLDGAPETTITTPPPPGPLTSPDQSFAFVSSEAGSTFQCSLDGVPFTTCTTPRSYSALAEGDHNFRVRAIDPMGNFDPTPASRAFTINATAPETTIVDGPAGPDNGATPTFRYRSSEAGSSFQCSLDGGAPFACNQPSGPGADAEFTFAALTEGPHHFEVAAVDPVGNPDMGPAMRDFGVDLTPPTITIDSGPTDPADQTPTFRYSTTEAGTSFDCRIDSGPWFGCSDPSSDPNSDAEATVNALADGQRNFQVRGTDRAGNTGPATSLGFTIDTSHPPAAGTQLPPPVPPGAPETVIDKAPKSKLVIRKPGRKVTFSFSSPGATATFECALIRRKRRVKVPEASSFVTCVAPRSYKKRPGRYVFWVRASRGGVTDPTPERFSFDIRAGGR